MGIYEKLVIIGDNMSELSLLHSSQMTSDSCEFKGTTDVLDLFLGLAIYPADIQVVVAWRKDAVGKRYYAKLENYKATGQKPNEVKQP